MAFLKGDSFDGYQTDLLTARFAFVSAGVSIDTLHGQCGSQSLKVIQTPAQGYVNIGLDSGGSLVCVGAVSVFTDSIPPFALFQYNYSITPIIVLKVAADGSIIGQYNPDAAFPPTSFVTQGGLVATNRLTYVGWEIGLGAANTGYVKIAIDGQERYSVTGISTAWPGEALAPTGFQLGGTIDGTHNVWFDSLILCNGLGVRNNALLGHQQAQWLFSDGPGANTDFSPTGVGANYEASDNNTPDPSTIYVSSNTVGAKDTYTYTNVPLIADTEILAVQGSILAVEDAAGTRTVDFVVRQGSTDYPSGNPLGVPTTDPGYLIFPVEDNPATTAQWLLNDVNADQYGGEIET